MPYVTEELWSALPMSKGLVMRSPYPVSRDGLPDSEAASRMELFKGLATSARNIRAEYRINPGARIELRIKTPGEDRALLESFSDGLKQLVRADRLVYGPDVPKEKGCAATPVGDYEVIVPLSGVADLATEVERLHKEKRSLESELAGVERKLGNEDFLAKARPDVVQKAREKRDLLRTELAKIEESLRIMGGGL
jgi:valyl-tRNA synthetase